MANPPETFRGRKVGALVTDDADAKVLASLRKALQDEGANLEIVAPTIGGVELSDGSWLAADQKIGGGPSVLYDAVVVIASRAGTDQLRGDVAAREFVVDAFAHDKFIGHTAAATPLLDAVGILPDEGVIVLDSPSAATTFVLTCRALRHWARSADQKVG